ncbi:MAG: insulinase family protein [Roseburia sp.]
MDFDKLTAYQLVKEENLPDIHSKGYLLKHRKSGARIALIPNEDENKVFYIGFRTPVEDSTGVPHIIEHTVLCGSDKFPVKDPFVELVKGSLNTFLNAMTYPDKTMYPVASCNDKDFKNLMDVYLDAVFHPNIYKKEEIFRQEGWHYELEDPDGPVTINGVVYNEMKGAFSSPEGVLDRMILSSLFPDTTYGNESGGDPECIPDLTYEQYLDFHRRYYHPSNSYIYLYGDMDMVERLEFLDREYLSDYDAIALDSTIALQKPFDKPVSVTKEYSIASGEKEEDNAYLSYNAVIGTNLEPRLTLAFEILDYALLNAPGAPLRQAILDAGIGKDVMGGFDNSTLQPVFSVVAKNANTKDADRLVQLVDETLRGLVKGGLNQRSLLAGINSSEFRFREADYGNYPKGLIYGLDCMDSWLYDEEEPFMYLKLLDTYAFLKEQVKEGYFEQLIDTYLLKNTHKSVVCIEPKKGLNARLEEKLAEKMARYKESLTPEQVGQLAESTRQLKQYQEEPSSREDLEKIPLLKRTDLRKQASPFHYSCRQIDGIPVIHTNVNTNGILYLNFLFDTAHVAAEDVEYLGILKAVLGFVDTEKYGFSQLADEINLVTGGMASKIQVYVDINDYTKISYKFEVRVKILYEKLEEALDLVLQILKTSSLTDEKRLHEILAQAKSRLQMSLSSAGHSVSAMRAMSYFSPVADYNDRVGGIALYRKVSDVEEHFAERYDDLSKKLAQLMADIFQKKNLTVACTADEDGYQLLSSKLTDFAESLPCVEIKEGTTALTCKKKNEGFMDASKVQYVSRAGNFVQKGYSYTGLLRILKVMLGYDYLWINVRVKGGAYGCMSGFHRNGDSFFCSYRDPNLGKTNEIYEGIPEYLRAFQADERDMTKFIIGTVSDMDVPLMPAAQGERSVSAVFSNVTYEDIQRERDEILNAQPEHMRGLADMMEAILQQDCLCVIGAEENLKAEQELFDTLEAL